MKLFDLINLYLQNANTYSNQQVPTKTRIYLNSWNLSINNAVISCDLINDDPKAKGWVLVKDGVLSLTGARDYISSVTNNDPNLVTVSYDYAVSSKPNDKALGELLKAEELLNQLEHLDNSQSTNASLILQQESLNQELRGVNQQIIKIEQQITSLQLQINNFNIASKINPLSPGQKAHLLQKTWAQKDDFSQVIVALIKDQEFNPHYANRENISLVDIALRIDDINFFKLLISKGLKFEQIALNKASQEIIKLLNEKGADFNKTFITCIKQSVKQNHIEDISKILSIKPNLLNEIAVNLTQAEAFDVFGSNNKVCEIFDAKGHNLLYYCLINSNIKAIKIFSEVTAKASLNKDMLNIFTQILKEDISLDTKIETFKVITEAKILDKSLVHEFANIADIIDQYPDIALTLQEVKADLMGQVL